MLVAAMRQAVHHTMVYTVKDQAHPKARDQVNLRPVVVVAM